MNPTRRRLLQVGVGGAVALAFGGLGIALQSTALRTPASELEVLSPREFSVLAAIAEAILPDHPELPTTAELQVAEKVDALLARLHPGVGSDLKQVLMLLENGITGVVFDGRVRPLSRLDVASRAAALEGWRTSSLSFRRTVFRAVAGLIGAAYWGDPRTHRFVGYQGPPAWILAIRDSEVPRGG